MRRDTLIFDLDGTLLDTLADIALACNAMLSRHGWPEHDVESYKKRVGNGFSKLVERAVPADASLGAEALAACVEETKAIYAQRMTERTRPYPGMPEALRALKDSGCRLAVLSNKVDNLTKALIDHFFPGLFTLACGAREGVPLKPDPMAVAVILRELGTDADHALYVGDSDVDMLTAKAAGLPGVGVLWGFRNAEELTHAGAWRTVASPMELIPLTGKK